MVSGCIHTHVWNSLKLQRVIYIYMCVCTSYIAGITVFEADSVMYVRTYSYRALECYYNDNECHDIIYIIDVSFV